MNCNLGTTAGVLAAMLLLGMANQAADSTGDNFAAAKAAASLLSLDFR